MPEHIEPIGEPSSPEEQVLYTSDPQYFTKEPISDVDLNKLTIEGKTEPTYKEQKPFSE